jgi:CDP-diglyceride synthetase
MDEHDETQQQASPGNTPGEGIRIIGADEAAALEDGRTFGRHGKGGSHDTDLAESDHPSFQRFPRPSPVGDPAPSWMAEGVEPGDDIDLTQPILSAAPADAGAGGPDDGEELRSERFVMASDVGHGPGEGGDLGEREGSRSRRAGWGGQPGDGSHGDQPSGVADFGGAAADTGTFQSERPAPPPRGARRRAPKFTRPRLRRPANDLTTRVLTGLGIGIAAAILFKLGSVTSLALVLLVVTPAAAELFGVLRRAGYRPATLVGLVATVGIVIGAYMKGEAAIPLVVALVVVVTLLWYLLGVVKARPTINVAVTLLGFLWVGLLGSFAALLLDPRIFPDRHGVALLLGATVATVGYDIGSFLVGGRFGRHLLAPAISPNKTWEGLIGGTVASVLVGAVVVSQISPWTTARGIALGLVVAVAAPLGDLCESLLKRDMGIKDMGAILPGHGGILDRADALLFVIPATYYLVRLINFGG